MGRLAVCRHCGRQWGVAHELLKMAWDRGYYYRAQRINGKPRRVYVGAGILAEMIAQDDAREQAQRAAQDAQRRRQKAQDRAIHKEIDAQYRQVRAFVSELMTAAGYRQYNREWRKMGKKAAAALTGPVADGAPVDLHTLVERVNAKNPTRGDLDALRRALDAQEAQDNAAAGLTVLYGVATTKHVIDQYTDNEAVKLVMQADARRIAKELGGDTAPAFERPLIDHIVTCWVRLQLVERDMSGAVKGSHSRESGAYWDRRLTEAQRRYLRAVNLLAKVRHVAPAVQVNVAHQQVVQNKG